VFEHLLAPASFAMPEWLPHSGWMGHGPFAAWLIGAHRPATLVELGTHFGFSYAAFCAAVRAGRLGTRCFAVDTWRGDEHAGFYDDSVLRNFAAYHDPRYAGFSELLRMTFDEALPRFAARSIDLLHIDGRHFYDDVRHDYQSWLPKLSERAVVLFHDTAERQRGFGVYRLWAELAERHPHFEFLHGHGLGVLGVGPEQSEPMLALFAASADQPTRAAVRQAYEFLGTAVEARRNLTIAVRQLRQAAEDAREPE
jgi:hypothetical protein